MPLAALFFGQRESWLATASRKRLALVAFCLAVISFLVTQGLHWLLFPLDHLGLLLRRMEADAVGSVVIGWLVYRVLRSLSERRRYTLERLRLIATLNHHIRNSLQVIQLSAQTTQHDGAIRHIDDSVQRITSVLADIIPMPDADPHLPHVEQRRPPRRA
ncbi:MAG TPA: hypothetical protein VLA96_12815 [Terriglobales bacterium]|nr:hypothetical protein [Terriglobales bacterium]